MVRCGTGGSETVPREVWARVEPRQPGCRPTVHSVAPRTESEILFSWGKWPSNMRKILKEMWWIKKFAQVLFLWGISGSQNYITCEWQRSTILLFWRILFKFSNSPKVLSPISKTLSSLLLSWKANQPMSFVSVRFTSSATANHFAALHNKRTQETSAFSPSCLSAAPSQKVHLNTGITETFCF